MPESPDVAQVTDGRRSPFCYQTHDALDAIRAAYENLPHPFGYGKLPTCIAVYVCLTEAANRHGGETARGGFSATRKEIAALAGISVDGLDKYVATLASIGLVEVIREKIGDTNLPNRWRLTTTPPSRAESATPSRASSALELRRDQEQEEVQDPPSLSPAIIWPKDAPTTVARKKVSYAEAELATQILASFNLYAASRFTPGAYLAMIIGRIREHPEVTLAGHQAIIRNVLDGKRWWDGRPRPNIVYGNAPLFEGHLDEAAAPPDPNRPMTSDQVRSLARARENVIDGDAVEIA